MPQARRRLPVLLTGLVLAILAPAASAQLPPPAPTPVPVPPPAPAPPPPVPTLPLGTHAGPVDIGGLTVAQATAKVDGEAGRPLRRRIWVEVADRSYRLTMRRARFELDAPRTGRRAVAATFAAGGQAVTVPLVLRFSRAAVRAFVADVQRRSYRAPRDARLTISLRRMIRHRGHVGRRLDAAVLVARIKAVLADPAAPRTLRAYRAAIRPRLGWNGLPRAYPTVLTVDRAHFKLRLFKRLRRVRTYRIAVGAAGYSTPAGLYRITSRQVNPAWHAPNAPWAGSYAGRVVPGGAPDNPLRARWLGIVNGVGIHGTAEPWSIGSRASHGCIRMRVGDVIDLYPRVGLGTPVLIG